MASKVHRIKCIKPKLINVYGQPRIQFFEGKWYEPKISGNKYVFHDHEVRYKQYPVRYTKKHLMEFFQFKFKYGK